MAQYTLLQFKNFRFPYNPRRFSVQGGKQMFCQFAPGMGDIVRQLGRRARTVTGEGEFFGAGARGQFEKLWALFLEQEDGLLALPATPPFYAYFTALTLVGEAGENLLRYSFTFLESDREAGKYFDQGTRWTVAAGEGIWQVAAGAGVSVAKLYQNNPALYTGELREGMELKL